MPGAGAESTQGALFKIRIGGVYTTVVGRTTLKPMPRSRNEIDTTDLDCDDEENMPGSVRRSGEYEITGHLVGGAASQEYLEDSFEAGDIEECQHVLTNGTVYGFDAWIKEHQIGEAGVDGKQMFTGKLRVTGAIVKS